MKKMINVGLSVLLLTNSAFASQNFQAMAKDYVANSHEVALQDAKIYVQQDFLKLVSNAFALTDVYQVQNAKLLQISSIEKEVMGLFESIALLENIESNNLDKAELFSRIEMYEKALRGYYALGWINIDHEFYYQQIIFNMQKSLNVAKEMCRVGRGNMHRSYTPSDIETKTNYANYDFGVQIHDPIVGTISMVMGGLPIGLSGSVNRVSASASKQANQNRSLALGATQTLAMAYANVKLTAATMTALGNTQAAATVTGGAMNSTLLAAGPYLVAAAVVMIVVNDIIVNGEAKRLQRKMVRAKKNMMYESADNQDVIGYYRENCQNSIPAIENFFSKILNVIDKNNAGASFANIESKKQDIDRWVAASSLNDVNTCKLRLDDFYSNVGCLSTSSFKSSSELEEYVQSELVKDDNVRDHKIQCVEDSSTNQIAYTFNRACNLPLNTEARKKEKEDAAASVDGFEKFYNIERVSDLASARVLMVLQGKDKVSDELRRISFQQIDQKSQRALSAVLKYFAMMRSHKALSQTSKMLLDEERVHQEYVELKEGLIVIARKYIQVLFNGLDQNELSSYINTYKSKLAPFVDEYSHVPEVVELVRTFEDVVSHIDEGF